MVDRGDYSFGGWNLSQFDCAGILWNILCWTNRTSWTCVELHFRITQEWRCLHNNQILESRSCGPTLFDVDLVKTPKKVLGHSQCFEEVSSFYFQLSMPAGSQERPIVQFSFIEYLMCFGNTTCLPCLWYTCHDVMHIYFTFGLEALSHRDTLYKVSFFTSPILFDISRM